MTTWKPSRDWLDRHDSSDLVYRIRVRFDAPDALEAAWAALATAHRADEDGALLLGGAAIEKADERAVDVVSGGEDALDSLAEAVNEVLSTRQGTPMVVSEERSTADL